MGEKCTINLAYNCDFHGNCRVLLHAANLTWDRRLYFPSDERHAEDFFAPKNPTASVTACNPCLLSADC
jgi:hypothetical protein